MKKFLMGVLLVCVVIVSTGCSLKNLGNMKFLKSEGRKAIDADVDQIITAIENKDADAIKELMAPMALDQYTFCTETIDTQIQRLFDFYQGKMISCEYTSGNETTRHGDTGQYGERIKRMARGSYIVTTDEDTYLLYVYHTVKSVTRDEEGVYCISIIRDDDYHKYNLMTFSAEADAPSGIHVTDDAVMEELERSLNSKGESGFTDVLWGYSMDIFIDCNGYNKGYDNKLDDLIDIFSQEVEVNKKDAKRLCELFDFNEGILAEVLDSGFHDGERLMYCEGMVKLTDSSDEDNPVLYRAKMKWQKCEDNAYTGLTYFAVMTEEDYQAGREFPDGEGLIILRGNEDEI